MVYNTDMRASEVFRPEDLPRWLVHHDEDLAVVNKPAGLLSQPGPPGEPDLVTLARAHFGDETLGVLHRLDRNVSGLVVLARTADAARWLSKQFAAGTVERQYLAVCRGKPVEDRFAIDVPLLKDERSNTVRVAREGEPLSQAARTEVEVQRRLQGISGRLVVVSARPISGRSHQIRVHLAHAGLPIVGDPKYGVRLRGLDRPLLHATRIEFVDHRVGERRQFESEPPFRLEEIVLMRPQK